MKSKTIHQDGKFIYPLVVISTHPSRSTTSVIAASIGSAASVYILVAITGYLSFGNKIAGNIIGMCK
jgi:amino acid permease